jgi:hypothetical protein
VSVSRQLARIVGMTSSESGQMRSARDGDARMAPVVKKTVRKPAAKKSAKTAKAAKGA